METVISTRAHRGNGRRFESARALAVLVVAGVAVAVLVGCEGELPDRSGGGYHGTPTAPGVPLTVSGVGPDVAQVWASGETLIVTSIGSGSCPLIPVVDGVDHAEKRVELVFETRDGEGPCTADMSPTTFEFDEDRDLAGYTVEVTVPSID